MNPIFWPDSGPPCNCDVCQRHRRWREIHKRGDVLEMRILIDDLIEALVNCEEELCMAKSDDIDHQLTTRST